MRMTANDNTVARTLHDLGLAAWFGGSLMGATGLNGAASVVDGQGRCRAVQLALMVTGVPRGCRSCC
jgi:hypothetical protein